MKNKFQYIKGTKTNICNEERKTKHGRPTIRNQNKIKKILQRYYLKGVSASATSKVTLLNIKTILKYFSEWDKKLLESEDIDFLRRAKITKERTIQTLDNEIISLDNHEKEINSIKNIARQTGNVLHFEKLSRLKLKISDQKFKILSAKINLVNTPTADAFVDLEKNND